MKKVVDYCIVVDSERAPNFSDMVKEKLSEGWELLGAPIMDAEGWPLQAMVKTEDARMILFVEGGIIHDIMSNTPIQVRVIDYDVEGSDDYVQIRLVEDGNKLSETTQDARVLKHDLKGEEDLTPFFNQDTIR